MVLKIYRYNVYKEKKISFNKNLVHTIRNFNKTCFNGSQIEILKQPS